MSTQSPSHVEVYPDGSMEPRALASSDIAIKMACDDYDGRPVAVIKGADWVSCYSCVETTELGRPILSVCDVGDFARELADKHKVTVSLYLIDWL